MAKAPPKERRPEQANRIKHGSVTINVNESVNRGRPLFFFHFYEDRRRHQRNFANRAAAHAEADTIVGQLKTDRAANPTIRNSGSVLF